MFKNVAVNMFEINFKGIRKYFFGDIGKQSFKFETIKND